jgi:RNA polymerase sigma-70 factor, ECF subfamily
LLKERLMGTIGDRSEFLKLFLKVQPAVRSYLLSLLRNGVDADDVFQEVSLVLWERFGDYDARYPFLNWAFGIARNHVARWRRSTPRARAWLPPEVEEKLAVTYAEIEDELSPRRKALQTCLEKLGAHARELLSLRYEKVWSLQQIASARGMTLNAVNKALGKIRKALSDCTGGTRLEEMGTA